VFRDRFRVKIDRVAFFNFQGALGAFAKARAETIAIGIIDQSGFAVDNGQRSFLAGDNTIAAAIA
jgi:hypothetical protein